jgi:hypothetical protein
MTPEPLIVEGPLELSRLTGLNFPAYTIYLDQQRLDRLLLAYCSQAGDTPHLGRVRLTVEWLAPLEPSPVGDTDILLDAGLERPPEAGT